MTTTPTTRRGVNPATEEQLPEIPVSTQDDVDKAVAFAQEAYKSWRALSWDERADYLLKYADAIEANGDGIRTALAQEGGKPDAFTDYELNTLLTHLRETAKMRIPDEVLQDNDDVCSASPSQLGPN